MKLNDIIHRVKVPKPWAEGEKIPWNDPAFSKRMLNEHLSQKYDAASRRLEIIDKHVNWINKQVLKGHPTRILDLGCGPGLYTFRLARLGHQCVGIDFSPASIAYAREQAEGAKLDCTYFQEDIRSAEFGEGYGMVMSIFGEFNVFRPQEAKGILTKAYYALKPDGLLLIEPHTFEAVVQLGEQSSSWYASESGLFAEEPHLCLQENFWDADEGVAIERYFIIETASGEVTHYSSSTKAYTDDEYQSLLAECRFVNVIFYPSLGDESLSPQNGLIAILAQKREN